MSSKSSGYKYKTIAVGGTFDHIHKGHRSLLSRAFDSGEMVYIGLTSDDFVKRTGKVTLHNYDERLNQLRDYLEPHFQGRKYQISKLEENFGPAVLRGEIEAIAVSDETKSKVIEANRKRRELGFNNLATEIVPMVVAYDHSRISSSRIRAGEIDAEGRQT